MKKRWIFVLLLSIAAVFLLAGCGSGDIWDSNRLNYNITSENVENGTLYVTRKGEKVTRAAEGEVLYVNLLPATGYTRESIRVNGETIDGASFRMPAGDVTLTATVRPVTGSIGVDSALIGGTVTADKTEAMYGETVTLTVTPDPDYALIERTLTVNGAEIYRGRIYEETKVTFRMPPHDVRVSARFQSTSLRISTIDEYRAFAAEVNAGADFAGRRVYLAADIGSPDVPVDVIVGSASDKAFAGTIEGEGYTVYLNVKSSKAAGLIGYSNGATVKNLTVKGTVTLDTANFYAGGFVGLVQWAGGSVTVFENCTNEATVTVIAASNAGGFVGRTLGNLTVTHCENKGAVTTTGNYAAGIVGYIHNSSAAGAGSPSLTVTDTANSGNITANTGVGGIVGLFHKGAAGGIHRLTNVSNTGTLTGNDQVGGLIGVITGQATDGFDITVSFREAGLQDAGGSDIVIGADNNKKTTVLIRLSDENAA